ncbi:hypothetical protein Uis1B_0898 [Bifidobacterium margollesii]|uniref:DUF202 domain-containing protein n=1 Tax=Bifidobacterium margollesii TaxID=2020964 RepID=A0A2N5JAM0_9BIFI|nr:DUF202 domain-containing protein [Bifidobacterium margollesii]PLS31262.1 hypothetical protein Uis1B_0898 [Bifidobacterium margollesii]
MVGGTANTIGRDDVVDKGLQIERTRLSWKRTVLNMTVFAILALRILPMYYAVWGAVVGVIGVAVTVIACVEYRRRASFYTIWFVNVDAVRKTGGFTPSVPPPPSEPYTFPTRKRQSADGRGPLAIALGISGCSAVCLILALSTVM